MIVPQIALAVLLSIVIPFIGGGQAAMARADPAPGVIGVTWGLKTLQAAGQQPETITDPGLTVIFGMDGRVTGSGGCNQFGGAYTAEIGGKLTISALTSTLIGCATLIAEREQRYLTTLQEVTGYALDDNGATLRLTFSGPGRQLVFGRSTANQEQVTGTVKIPAQVTLPANAIVRVQLVRTPPTGPATVVAEQVGSATGAPPYPFTLGYDPLQIVANNTYGVRVTITVDGQEQLQSRQPYLVITQGRPITGIAVLAEGAVGPTALPVGGGGWQATVRGEQTAGVVVLISGFCLLCFLVWRYRRKRVTR